MTVYGPAGIREFIEVSLKISKSYLKYPIEIIEIEEGVIFDDDQFTVEARLLEHGIPSYGYRIVEKDRPGTLLADKLAAAGVKPGPDYKKIKNGEEVVLEDGRVMNPDEFVGPPQKGRIVTILGDTRVCQNAVLLAKDADLLIHEATFSEDEDTLAHEYFHSTTLQAAETAVKAGVRKLCLTHISSRYDRNDWRVLEAEAVNVFTNTVISEDFMEIGIPLNNG